MTACIAISMGDPLGIGPEVTIKALTDGRVSASFQVYGARAIYERTARQLGLTLPEQRIEWIEVGGGDRGEDLSGGAAGTLQVASLAAAVAAVRAGRADALCTAPITKAAARAAGFPFPGHTEYLAHSFGVSRYAMMLAGPASWVPRGRGAAMLRVVPLTGHVPLREVASLLTPELVADRACVTVEALAWDFGLTAPRVGVAGLNPHAGELGMLGDEEQRVLAPGLALAREALARRGLAAELVGPLPADAIFVPPVEYDAVLCCYHDQALIPLKMCCRDAAVNVTLGLPAVRTSPAHGSALDIAGRGVARPESMIAALRLAAELASLRSVTAARR